MARRDQKVKLMLMNQPDTTAPPARPTRSSVASPALASSQPWPSEQLLRGNKVVEIHHNGEIYRLQSTRQGKLILTK